MSGIVLLTLENALRAWVRTVLPTGWNSDQVVIWGDQNGPKPGVQSVELRRGNPYVIKIGRDVQGSPDPTPGPTFGRASRQGVREINFGIRAYNTGALQVVQDLIDRLDDEDTTTALFQGALAHVDSSPLQNLTRLYSSQYKEVAGADLRFRTHSLREGADGEPGVGYIQTVVLELETRGISNDVLSTDTLVIPPDP